MHFDKPADSSAASQDGPWYKELTRYHWFVFTVSALAWLADCMDQQLFTLARNPAIRELRNTTDDITTYSGLATTIFMVGWATGGLIFGIMGDRWGRAKTMMLTILLYSLFTGLSALSFSVWDFAFYRFLTGLGVGGEFAVGVALVAEVMPDRARPHMLGWLQASSTIGNVSAAFVGMALAPLESASMLGDWKPWRYMFLVGALPALLTLAIGRRLKEPERWRALKASMPVGQQLGSMAELFKSPTIRRNAIVGLILATSGVVGLWGIGFFGPDLVRTVFRDPIREEVEAGILAGEITPESLEKEVEGRLTHWASMYSFLLNIGAFLGVYSFSRFTQRMGRKPAFAVAFTFALLSTALTFFGLRRFSDFFWMVPLMGFFQLSLFGGYAIYFPELFPTRLRSTGTSFCYNVGRYLAAAGPLLLGTLTDKVFQDALGFNKVESLRWAGVTMCSFFLLGLAVLPFAPETKGKPLPE